MTASEHEIDKNAVVLLPAGCLSPHLIENVEFCLRIARKYYQAKIVYVISDGQADIALTSHPVFKGLDVRPIALNTRLYPLDIGNNQFLKLPIAAYAALPDLDAEYVITPLRGGGSYFLQMAKKGGLLPSNPRFVTTLYLPETLRLQAEMILPLTFQNVIDTDLERFCAKQSDVIWVTHPDLKSKFSALFSLDEHVELLAENIEQTNTYKPAVRALTFYGAPSYTYGFDIFLRLALKYQHHFEKITIVLPRAAKIPRVFDREFNRLKQSKGTLVLIRSGGCEAHLEETTLLLAPMRCDVFPEAARLANMQGVPVIWSTGFERVEAPGRIASDVRDFSREMDKILNPAAGHSGTQPAQIKTAAVSKSSPVRKRPKVRSVSIVITHHNRSMLVPDALESLRLQTFKNFDVIIVDDGSTEEEISELRKIVDGCGLGKVSVETIENSYPAIARNHGAMRAQADAIFFMDDDNALAPQTLEHFVNALNQTDIVLSFLQSFEGPLPPFPDDPQMESDIQIIGPSYGFSGLNYGSGYFHNILGNASFMIRRADFLNLGGFSKMYGIGLEDYTFLLDMAKLDQYDSIVLPRPYLYFRIHESRIRLGHIDWTAPRRLQAGHWRLFNPLLPTHHITSFALAYARQLHEITQYQFVPQQRPAYFRLKSIWLHQYIRKSLARIPWLRSIITNFTDRESRLAKHIESWIFK